LDGLIYQDLPTVPGASYKLRFAFAGNFLGEPRTKTLVVLWRGLAVADVYFDSEGRSGTNMGWMYREFILTATNSTTRLAFSAPLPNANGYGPVIDDVSVEPAPCGGRLDLAFDAGTRVWSPFGSGCYCAPTSRLLCTNLTSGEGLSGPNHVSSIVVQPDGKIILAGGSDWEVSRTTLARFYPDGSLDTEFVPTVTTALGGPARIDNVVLRPNGKLLIGGTFRLVNGQSRVGLAQLNSDGSLDTDFVPSAGITWNGTFALVPEGKVVASGFSTNLELLLVRLMPTGELDSSFELEQLPVYECSEVGTNELQRSPKFISTLPAPLSSLLVQPDGRILLSGLIRLHPNGSHDTSYAPVLAENFLVSAVALQADGKILLAGGVSAPGPGTCDRRRNTGPNVIRLHADGSPDVTFSAPYIPFTAGRWCGTADLGVRTMLVQTDGKIVLGGMFTMVNGVERTDIARLNPDGSLDLTFQMYFSIWYGADEEEVETVTAMAFSPQGKVYLGGLFRIVNGQSRSSLVRIETGYDPRPYRIDVRSLARTVEGNFRMNLEVPSNSQFAIQASSNLVNWMVLSNLTIGASSIVGFEDAEAASLRFYRIAAPPCEP
jgi:uncharacterized delta-60 repeat protein